MDIEKKLSDAGIIPDPLKDQFFLKDENVVKKMIDLSALEKKDVVLEIGAGTGILTGRIAEKAGKVIAYEIDTRFKRFLDLLPDNVDVRFEDAHMGVSQGGKSVHKKQYSKVVSNIPFSVGEWLLHNLTFVDYDKVILLVAKKFARSSKANPVFSSFFDIQEKMEVSKDKFYPVPKTDSVIIDLIKLPDSIKTGNLSLFLRQFIYQHEDWKVKNSLREGLIKYHYLVNGERLTKNKARQVIKDKGISNNLLEERPLSDEIYGEVSLKFS